MLQKVQVAIAAGPYAESVRGALSRGCAWHVEFVDRPDPSQPCVLVLDESALESLPLPVANPERVVLITRKDPQSLAEAWDAGIVSVVSESDPLNTVLLAVMAAGLRIAKTQPAGDPAAPQPSGRAISPKSEAASASIAPESRPPAAKRCKIQ